MWLERGFIISFSLTLWGMLGLLAPGNSPNCPSSPCTKCRHLQFRPINPYAARSRALLGCMSTLVSEGTNSDEVGSDWLTNRCSSCLANRDSARFLRTDLPGNQHQFLACFDCRARYTSQISMFRLSTEVDCMVNNCVSQILHAANRSQPIA